MTVQEIREAMAAAHSRAESILARADGEHRALAEGEQSEVDKALGEFDALKRQLETRGRLDEATAAMSMSQGRQVAPFTPGRGGPDPRTRAPYDQKADPDNLDDYNFRSLGEQLRAVRNVKDGNHDPRLDVAYRAQSEGSGVGGGFLIAPRFEKELLARAAKAEPWLDLVRTTILPGYGETPSVSFPALADNVRSSNEISGFKTAVTMENAAIAEDSIDFETRTLSLTKEAKLIKVPNELMSDSAIPFSEMLDEVVSRYVRLKFSQAIVRGTGAGEPLGVLNGVDKYSLATSTTAGNLLIADIAGMVSRLEVGAANPAFIMHPGVLPALAKLRPTNTTAEPIVWASNAGADMPLSVYGVPLYKSDVCSTLNTVGDIILGGWGEYMLIRTQVIVENSYHSGFGSDQTHFVIKWRWAGQPKNSAPLTDRQSFTAASFITLAVRS